MSGTTTSTGCGPTCGVSDLDAALLLDERLGLDERLSSALSVRRHGGGHPLAALVAADADRHAEGIDIRRALPRVWLPETKLCLCLLVLLVVTACLPQFGFWRSESDRAIEMVSREVGKELAEVARKVEKEAEDKHLDAARTRARAMLQEALKLRRARMGKEETLRRLEKLNRSLQAEREKLAGQPLRQGGRDARQSLREMGGMDEKIAESLENPTLNAAQELLKETARELRQGKATSKQKQQVADQLQKAAEALKGSPHQGLADKLQKAADALKQSCKESGQGSCDKAAEAVEQAAEAISGEAGKSGDQDLMEEMQEYCEGAKGAAGDCEGIQKEGENQGGGECPGGLCERYGGQAGRNRGPGSTNEGAEPTPAEGAEQHPYQPGDSPADRSKQEWERLYAPRRTETLQHDERARTTLGSRGKVTTTQGPREAPNFSDARTPFYDVLESYKADADNALSRGDIPITERQRVKSYFDELHRSQGK
ncbi:MAG: hypothetical protein HYU66_21320 [Armatimonadetes bacterium]|nr:hypothetical protein [Armatimonadota bacterium]